MKILFVCRANVGRSQIAEELFNHYTLDHIGLSAGTHATEHQGKKLKEFAHDVVAVMKEMGIDVSEKTPLQLKPEIADFVDKIIAITHKEDLPSYVIASTKVEFWNIPDAAGKDYEFHVKMRNDIDTLVKKLLLDIMHL